MITLTESAIKRTGQLLTQHDCPGGLRLGVQGGGCSGMSYVFRLDPAPKAKDQRHGIR